MLLKISVQQLEALQNHQEARFLESLRQHVQRQYPAYAEVSPRIMTRLIGFGVARARDYGFTWQSSLGSFVYLMAAVAPNFDLQPVIHAILVNPAIPIEKRLDSLNARLPAGVWAEAEAAACSIGWFMPRDEFLSTRPERIASALINALPDAAKRHPAHGAIQVKQALHRAEQFGFGSEDQQWVFAAACLHYGENFTITLAWARELFTPQFLPQTQISLLRVRLAVDAGIWI